MAKLYNMTDAWLPWAITIHVPVRIYNIAFYIANIGIIRKSNVTFSVFLPIVSFISVFDKQFVLQKLILLPHWDVLIEKTYGVR